MCRRACCPSGWTLLDDAPSVVDNVLVPRAGAHEVNPGAGAARALPASVAWPPTRLVSTLSGGERFRASLAALLLTDPAPQLLMLDEPTNNLDLASYDALVSALTAYRGALLVVSHDPRFLEDAGVDRVLELG